MYETSSRKKQSNSTKEKQKTKTFRPQQHLKNKIQQLKSNENITIIDNKTQIPLKLYFPLCCDWQPILFCFKKNEHPTPQKNYKVHLDKKISQTQQVRSHRTCHC